MAKIQKIQARSIFDSRGIPSVEVDLYLKTGEWGRFSTPSGASCGSKEALELRDQDETRYRGKGVSKAIAHIHGEISEALLGSEDFNQQALDECLIKLDGTPNKSRLGANAILPVSGAFFHAMAQLNNQPLYGKGVRLPMPMINVINGGSHANNGLNVQEFMIVPKGATSFSEAMRMASEVFQVLKSTLNDRALSTAVGDEGGFAPALANNEEALQLLMISCEKAGYQPGKDIYFALDVAASELLSQEKNCYHMNNEWLSRADLLQWYKKLSDQFPIISIEDPFGENDYQGFIEITKTLGTKVQIVGDDLFVTNERYIKEGIENSYANAVLIKMNQIGTMSETLRSIELAQSGGMKTIISHRSGETEDTTIADLAVLTHAGQIKTGSMSRSERIAKYNRLLRIEEMLGDNAVFGN
ncbi:MAG: phosphopyruvate hydratase [Myxococcales bacterium]|nr:phosphopyruvate hydratase [Myxococcales bacterium]USN51104.1 MAG: phosphopyruvate hydratase [Myxococcales bacterium]